MHLRPLVYYCLATGCSYSNFAHVCVTTLFIYIAVSPPTNVRATVLTPRSVVVTWNQPSSPIVTGYFISYITTASYTSGGRVRVIGHSTKTHTLTNLEENTLYTIAVQATDSSRTSPNSNEVS